MEKNKKNIGVFKEKPRRRSLEELNLIDDFLFQEIISRGGGRNLQDFVKYDSWTTDWTRACHDSESNSWI